MTSQELRAKFLKFFEKNDHKIIPSASLVPSEEEQLEGKEKVLFTSAGMQPLIPYLTGQKEPPNKKLADVQKCLRTDDIEKVGDAVHHTFFEMLGNWSIGDYWKEEAIRLSFEFLTQELEIPIEKLAISVFAGDEDAPKDEESAQIWKSLGISEKRIFYFGKNHNWWPTGEKSGLCGPDTEMFYWIGEGKPEGKPNEDSRWVEIWNDVFMQFNRKEDGTLEDLPQKNVDTGMGLERTLAVLNGKESDYETDLFKPIMNAISEMGRFEIKMERIIADHLKAAVFLILDGVRPGNKQESYVLRRLLRRSSVLITRYPVEQELHWGTFSRNLVEALFNIYDGYYGIEMGNNVKKQEVAEVIISEVDKFEKTLRSGLKEIEKIEKIDGKKAFDLYQTFGFPYEVTEELFRQKGQQIDREQFKAEFEKHRELSRTASSGMFKGGLADHSEMVIKYHTATHLLHRALRDVLGPEVFQKGSNITAERLRFDFSFDRKMTDEEIERVEDLVNEKIKEDLVVTKEVMDKDSALQSGALGFFNEKYGDKVKVYTIGNPSTGSGSPFSREICGGPHIERTGAIGKIQIIKEEAVSSGIRRIRAEIVLR
ncbi:MAG: alanine--tRNA ligase [Candidatus Daviesbacteria bacterium]|nr:alanine--tRNA ligase [Candidatus Daviesbacteria bacterium]